MRDNKFWLSLVRRMWHKVVMLVEKKTIFFIFGYYLRRRCYCLNYQRVLSQFILWICFENLLLKFFCRWHCLIVTVSVGSGRFAFSIETSAILTLPWQCLPKPGRCLLVNRTKCVSQSPIFPLSNLIPTSWG